MSGPVVREEHEVGVVRVGARDRPAASDDDGSVLANDHRATVRRGPEVRDDNSSVAESLIELATGVEPRDDDVLLRSILALATDGYDAAVAEHHHASDRLVAPLESGEPVRPEGVIECAV